MGRKVLPHGSKSDLPLKIMYFRYLQTEILEETIHYIDSLHEQLIATIRTKGLPTSLRQSLEANKGKKTSLATLIETQRLTQIHR